MTRPAQASGENSVPQRSKSARNFFILLTGALFALAAVTVLGLFRQTMLRRAAAEPAIYVGQTSPEVIARIGQPIEAGTVHGHVREGRNAGFAHVEIPLTGGHGQGTLIEWAQRDHSPWKLCSLIFRDQNGELQLVDPMKTQCHHD